MSLLNTGGTEGADKGGAAGADDAAAKAAAAGGDAGGADKGGAGAEGGHYCRSDGAACGDREGALGAA